MLIIAKKKKKNIKLTGSESCLAVFIVSPCF